MKWTKIDDEHYESPFYRVTYNKALPDDHRWVLEYKNSTLMWEHVQNFYNPRGAKDFAERREVQKKNHEALIRKRLAKRRQKYKRNADKIAKKELIIKDNKTDVAHINSSMKEIKKQLASFQQTLDKIGLTKEAKVLSDVNAKLVKWKPIRKDRV